jgi:hypothetical protein
LASRGLHAVRKMQPIPRTATSAVLCLDVMDASND